MTRISLKDRLEAQPESTGEKRRFKRLSPVAVAIAVLLVLIGLAATLPGIAVGSDAARQSVIARLERMTGQTVAVDGAITFSLLPRTRLVLNAIRIGDADTFTVGQIVADLDVTKALRGRASLSRLVMIRPEVRLGAERPNDAAREASSEHSHDPRTFARTLLGRVDGLKSVELRDGAVRSHSDGPGTGVSDINLTVAQTSAEAPFSLAGSFVWNGQQADLTIDVGAPNALLAGQSSRVEFDLSSPFLSVSFDGTASLDFNATVNGRLRVTSASLDRGIEWLAAPDVRVPDVGPLSLEGELLLAGLQANLRDADLSISGNRGRGALEASFAAATPAVGGTLAFANLDFTPFARAIIPLPDDPFDFKRPIDLEFAGAVKLDIRLSAAQAMFGPVPLTDVAAVITLGGGRAKFDMGDAAVFGGRSQGNLVLDTTQPTASATGRLSATGIDTARLLTALKIDTPTMAGRSNLSIDMRAPLVDWASILRDARLDAAWVSRDGEIRGFAPGVFAESGVRPLADGIARTTYPYTRLEVKVASAGSKIRLKSMRMVDTAGVLAARGTLSNLGGNVAIRGRYEPSQDTFTTSKPIAFTIDGQWPNPDVTTR